MKNIRGGVKDKIENTIALVIDSIQFYNDS